MKALLIALVLLSGQAIACSNSSTHLRDAKGHIIGRVDTNKDCSQELRDTKGHILGYFSPKDNKTRDALRHVVGSGNTLPMLLIGR